MRSRSPFSSSSPTSASAAADESHHPHNPVAPPPPPCTRLHQIGAVALVVATFLLTRSLDRLSSSPLLPAPQTTATASSSSSDALFDGAGSLAWPQRGYGPRLDLRIYVYDEAEIDGLRELMRGRDGRISPESCVKGQWGTQV